MNLKTQALLTLTALSLCSAPLQTCHAGTHIWTGGGSTEFWNNPANWTGGVPLIGEAAPITLIFTNGPITTNNINGLVVDSLQFQGDSATVYASGTGSLTIRGGNSPTNLWFKGNLNQLMANLPITISGSNYWVVNSGKHANIYAALGGTGSLTWDGEGTATYYGSVPNTLTGPTRVRRTQLKLDRTTPNIAIVGPLILETSSLSGHNVELLTANQIADSVPVTIHEGSRLFAQSFNEKFGPLTLHGGSLNLVNGILTLNGNVDATEDSHINSPISLGGSTRTFTIATNTTLVLSKTISDGGAAAGLTLVGGGRVRLVGTNTFTGNLLAAGAWIRVESPFGLGATNGGTLIGATSTLELSCRGVTNETLTLAGVLESELTNTWTGPVTVQPGSQINLPGGTYHLTLSGLLSGTGALVKNGPGTLVLSGSQANTYSGGTVVNHGTLFLNKTGVLAIPGTLQIGDSSIATPPDEVVLLQAQQIAETAKLIVTNSGVLNLNGFNETIGSLTGNGKVHLGIGALTTGGDNTSTTFNGLVTGSGATSLVKNGLGTFTFTGTNNSPGVSLITQGMMVVNGSFTGPVQVSLPGYLAGTGIVGHATCNSGYFQPGVYGPGTLTVSNLALNNTTTIAFFELGTATNDHVNARGTVTINNAQLNLTATTAGAIGRQFVLIANDGGDAVTGTFNGVPEGGTVYGGNLTFTLSYQGGTGNDVVLTQVTQPASPQIHTLTQLPNGKMQLNASGEVGYYYEIQACTNLAAPNWTTLHTLASDWDGSIPFTDTAAPEHPQRFYRVRMQ